MAPPKGLIPWNKGKKGVMKANSGSFTREKCLGNTNGFKKGQTAWNKGKKTGLNLKHSAKMRGKIPWNKGKRGLQVPWNKGTKGIMKAWNKGKAMGPNPEHSKRMRGRKISLDTRKKMSDTHKIRVAEGKCHLWKGGIMSENLKIRTSIEFRLWREAVFKRDNWTCVWCGQIGMRLNADHIKPFALFPELRLEITNGRTLCELCHKKTETFGGRMNNHKTINNYLYGRK